MKPGPQFSRNDLSSLDLFEGLSPSVLDEVIAVTRCRALARDTRIFNQGDGYVRAHLLVEGSVRIAQTGSDGGQIVVRFIGPGEMFGTVALFTDGKYPADADTLTDAIEFSWSEADLLKLMGAHSQIAINALKIVGKRIQEAQNRLRELGAFFEGGPNWQPYAVRDANLITGQNPQSSALVAQQVLDALRAGLPAPA